MTVADAPIMIMAGGTGGHVFPALAVAAKLRERGVPLVWLGSARGLENQLVPAAGIELQRVGVSGLRGVGLRRRLGAPWMLTRAGAQALALLRRYRPRAVLGMGGFASGPGGVAARGLGTPLIIHEQNATPGTTNRYLARFATAVLQGFPGSFPERYAPQTVGNPVRAEVLALAAPRTRFDARAAAGAAPRLLLLGGSQGAQALNETLPRALARLAPRSRPRVWHQSGRGGYDSALAGYRQAGLSAAAVAAADAAIVVEPFIDDMAAAYGWADLVIARAGALTVAELAAAGVGALLVPFPHAIDDHQTANAMFLQRAGGARLLPQTLLDAPRLAGLLEQLLGDRAGLLAMAEAARRAHGELTGGADAAERVSAVCLDAAGR